MPRCAFLSTDDLAGFVVYDREVVPHLEARGWQVDEVPWRAAVDWRRYDLVVVRSPWDYQDDAPAFLATLERIAAVTRLENSLALCRWNLEKTYLRQLETAGVDIVPTRWLAAGELPAADDFQRLATDELVLKPVVSANADATYRLTRSALVRDRELLATAFARRPAMLQPLVRSILDTGEASLFYFAGDFSHAVRKLPAAGDFRVQEEHGGRISALVPDAALDAAGSRVMAALPAAALYARVDLVRHGERWCLMEVELVEPSLYFPYAPGSAARFAAAIDGLLPR